MREDLREGKWLFTIKAFRRDNRFEDAHLTYETCYNDTESLKEAIRMYQGFIKDGKIHHIVVIEHADPVCMYSVRLTTPIDDIIQAR